AGIRSSRSMAAAPPEGLSARNGAITRSPTAAPSSSTSSIAASSMKAGACRASRDAVARRAARSRHPYRPLWSRNMDLARFPPHPLTFGPTPLEPLPRLSAYLGGKVEIWAKREDCNSGLSFGGNKIRKLEYLVPDILAQGCDTLVSIGGVQSNHTRQVAAVAAKLGLKCHLIQGSWVDWPDGAYDRVGNIQLSRILGAAIEFSHEDFSIALKESWARGVEAGGRAGGKPYVHPAGASD